MSLWDALKRLIPFYGAYLQKQDRYERLQQAGLEEPGEPYQKFFSDLDSAANSLKDKYAGTGLTEAEREANAFTAEREDIAWQRQMDADSTVYQRRVADMQAAGINPLLAAGGVGVSSPSAHAGASVSPGAGNLSGLISAISNLSLISAQRKNIEADTKVKEAEAEQTSQQIDYFERVKGFREEAERLVNDLTKGQIRQINQNIDESISRVKVNLSNSRELDARAILNIENSMLARANAENIEYMRPFIAAELSARTSQEKAQCRLIAVEEAYQQGLIDSGAIEAAVRKQNADASNSEVEAKSKEFVQSIRDGSLRSVAEKQGDWRSYVTLGLYQGLSNAVKAIRGNW